jgi:hypothetical protein
MMLCAILVTGAFAQQATPPAVSATSVLTQLAAAFAGPTAVQKVQISGSASWHAGSPEDSGTVELTASSNGAFLMQLNLAARGEITETQTGRGSSATCQWSGSNGTAHKIDAGNCWRAALWFLPAFSLQPSLMSTDQVVSDLSVGTVGSSEATYRHLQGQIVPANAATPNTALKALIKQSTTDIGLNPTTLLPAVLTYTAHPDGGAPIPIAIEIRYSDYRPVSGVQIPFHIERYVNGALQLDIQVGSATIN